MGTWLVTGGTGFLGRHIVQTLRTGVAGQSPAEMEVILLGRTRPTDWPEDAFVFADLTDTANLRRVLGRIAPDFVIHAAGRTPPAVDDELYRANFWATTHLLSTLRSVGKPVRIILTGSAAELGPVHEDDLPVKESQPCQPVDAYGRSKWLATLRGLAESAPLEVIVARVFNAIGPGLPATQALGRFAARLGEPGPDPLTMTVGDLQARRDFIDVRDVAQAMIALALRGHAGKVYHVGTAQSRPVREGLDLLISLSGRSVRLKVDPSIPNRRGPADSRAAIDRIVAHTGWRPAIPWTETLADLWDEVCQRTGRTRLNEGAAA
jgi:GDP-4-dehydro-6-deoxy-D-mannose reductase